MQFIVYFKSEHSFVSYKKTKNKEKSLNPKYVKLF